MSISGLDDAKTPTKVRQPLDRNPVPMLFFCLSKKIRKLLARQPPAKRRLDNGQGWLSTCLLQTQQQPALMSI